MEVILTDLFDTKLFQIYDGFVSDGTFTSIVKADNLSKGIYFLNILIDGKFHSKENYFRITQPSG